MPFKFIPDPSFFAEINQDEALQAELHKVAEAILPKAVALATAAGEPVFAASLRVEDGVRPKGRSFSRVIADDPSATAVEFGANDTERRRILGEAAGTQVNTRGNK